MRLLNEKFTLGLFENPYVDEEAASQIVGNSRFQARADIAMRKSIVLLRNEENTLPIKPKTKVYFESYYKRNGATTPSVVFADKASRYNIEFVASPNEADVILLWITPGAKSLFEADGSPLLLSLSKNAVDINYINQLTAQKPTILAINYTNPWVIDEIYDDTTRKNIRGVMATFGTTTDALLDIVTGATKPTGKMPFSTPISEAAAQNQKSDVPGYLEGPGYALFNYDAGLTYP